MLRQKQKLSIKNSQEGFSLIEVFMAMSILTIFSLSLIGGLVQMRKFFSKNKRSDIVHQQVWNLMQNIQENPNLYEKHYGKATFDSGEATTLAWSNEKISKVSECPSCPGRLYYLILQEEINSMSYGKGGLYKVSIRFTHKNWDSAYEDYHFLIREK